MNKKNREGHFMQLAYFFQASRLPVFPDLIQPQFFKHFQAIHIA